MSTWNYRIVRRRGTPAWLGVHKIYYDDAGEPIVMIDPISFSCDEDEGAEGLVRSLSQALADAQNLPVLDEGDIGSREGTDGRAAQSVPIEIIDGVNDFASDDPRSPSSIARASDIAVLIAALEDEYSLPRRAAGPLSTSLEWKEIKRRLTGIDPLDWPDEPSQLPPPLASRFSEEEIKQAVEDAIEKNRDTLFANRPKPPPKPE